MVKKHDMMTVSSSSPPKGFKVHPLIPCNYLDTFVFDGRGKYLGTSVLDGGVGETQLNKLKTRKLFTILTKCILDIFCIFCILCDYVIICTSCISIAVNISSKMNIAAYIITTIVATLELYSLSHLKLSQLLMVVLMILMVVTIDCDVESNLGPVDNKAETPKCKGRPKKGSRGFKGCIKPKKLDFATVVDTNKPISVVNMNFFEKISVIQSDILSLKCDAIVNAAKMSLLGGGALDGKIHMRAGIGLSLKCKAIPVISVVILVNVK